MKEKSINYETSRYFLLLKQSLSLFDRINDLFLISLTDVFLDQHFKSIKENNLITDLMKLIQKYQVINSNNNNDEHKNLDYTNYLLFNQEEIASFFNKSAKQIIKDNIENDYLSTLNDLDNILNSEHISNYWKEYENKQSQYYNKNKNKNNQTLSSTISKKTYEVQVLSSFIEENLINNKKNVNITKDTNISETINYFLELGCGKSYLFKELKDRNKINKSNLTNQCSNINLNTKDLFYIGIDKKEDLIEKTKTENEDGLLVYNHMITSENFENILLKSVLPDLKDTVESRTKIKKINKNNSVEVKEDCNTVLDLKEVDLIDTNDISVSNIKNAENIENETELINTKESYYNLKGTIVGLHSCGNLTSDGIRIFTKGNKIKKYFENLVMIGCCFNLITEYISPEIKETTRFKSYINSLGKNDKGQFLDNTLTFELEGINNLKIGYPLSEYIKNNNKTSFFGRIGRNSAMQSTSFILDSKSNLNDNFNKLFFRALFQKLLEDYIPELKYNYGLVGRIKKVCYCFEEYIIEVIKNIKKRVSNKNNIEESNLENSLLNILENKLLIKSFIQKYCDLNNVEHYKSNFVCLNFIRVKFAKLIEVIVNLDRIVYMIENGVSEDSINLVKIFDEEISDRNFLIFK